MRAFELAEGRFRGTEPVVDVGEKWLILNFLSACR